VLEIFGTAEALDRNANLVRAARDASASVDEVSPKGAAALSETVTPQGLVAVCQLDQPTVSDVLAASPRLLVVLVEPNDPGNLGTIVRTADAAGADALLLDGGVDAYNGKAIRASAGSLFHLPVLSAPTAQLLSDAERLGLTSLATSGYGDTDLDALADDGTLTRPTVWLFGAEAQGLPPALLDAADHRVRVPIYGRAESLNLAAAAAVCLYASARAHR
jgi:TrmH family RNA methyltransferase